MDSILSLCSHLWPDLWSLKVFSFIQNNSWYLTFVTSYTGAKTSILHFSSFVVHCVNIEMLCTRRKINKLLFGKQVLDVFWEIIVRINDGARRENSSVGCISFVLSSIHNVIKKLDVWQTETVFLYHVIDSPETSRSRWLPVSEPGSTKGFFLLEGCFSFPLLPGTCPYLVVWLLRLSYHHCGLFTLQHNAPSSDYCCYVTIWCYVNKSEFNWLDMLPVKLISYTTYFYRHFLVPVATFLRHQT